MQPLEGLLGDKMLIGTAIKISSINKCMERWYLATEGTHKNTPNEITPRTHGPNQKIILNHTTKNLPDS